MVASGALSLDDAYKAVDLDTITLLLGMMIVVASLRLFGLLRRCQCLGGGARQATFDPNDAICLGRAPLVLELTLALGRRPAPYLLTVAMASNVGSIAIGTLWLWL
jgi:Na+/H+ antiporter NhaD/arsenite permease-like protein